VTLIGYARVSTLDQDDALQHDALDRAGVARTFSDTISGARTVRPQLSAALAYLREGDTLVVWKLDRLGRSLRELIDLVGVLEERGIGFRSLTEAIDTTTPGGRLFFHLMGAMAEFERDLIRERTRAGMAAAKGRGRHVGRPPVMTPERAQVAKDLSAKQRSLAEIATTLGVSRTTVKRALDGAYDRASGPGDVTDGSGDSAESRGASR
jgi:DNA invertase Pin-like site-specific DNA recombinase